MSAPTSDDERYQLAVALAHEAVATALMAEHAQQAARAAMLADREAAARQVATAQRRVEDARASAAASEHRTQELEQELIRLRTEAIQLRAKLIALGKATPSGLEREKFFAAVWRTLREVVGNTTLRRAIVLILIAILVAALAHFGVDVPQVVQTFGDSP